MKQEMDIGAIFGNPVSFKILTGHSKYKEECSFSNLIGFNNELKAKIPSRSCQGNESALDFHLSVGNSFMQREARKKNYLF